MIVIPYNLVVVLVSKFECRSLKKVDDVTVPLQNLVFEMMDTISYPIRKHFTSEISYFEFILIDFVFAELI